MTDLKELFLGIGILSIIILLIVLGNKWEKKQQEEIKKNPPPELTEEEKTKQEELETKMGFWFMTGFGIVAGLFACWHIYNNTDWVYFWDLEKKKYIPVITNNEFYVINQKNGKTYKLEKKEISDTYFYEYQYLAAPKIKKIKVYSKTNPINLDTTH